MIDIFVYPVSAVMKLWHLLLSQLTFINSNVAWIISIALLVITIRSIIAPLSWISIRSGRIASLMRPEAEELGERLKEATEVEDAVALLREQQHLRERHKFNPAAGCFPPLLMVPFFIGLYQVVLRMSRDINLSEVGFLNAADITSFRATTVNEVSLTALSRDHMDLVTPVLWAAIIFTVINLCITLYRGFLTTHFDQTIARRMFWMLCAMVLLVPYTLYSAAATGPLPVAVIIYWGFTNLYSMLLTMGIEFALRRHYPLTDAVHDLRRESWQQWRQARSREGKAAAKAGKAAAKADKAAAKADKAAEKEKARAHARLLSEARELIRQEDKEAKKKPS